MVKTKLITAVVLLALLLILVLQNTQPVETTLLFVTVTLPVAALLAITILIGMAAGILFALSLSVKKQHKKP